MAKESRLSLRVVNKLVCKVQKNKKLLDELVDKRDLTERRRKTIAGVVSKMNELDTFVDSAKTVKKTIEETHKLQTTDGEIRSVMRKDLGMRFKKVIPVSIHTNSETNLVCRQQFALKFIELLAADKIILNIDETWLGMCDFRHRKW